MWFCTLEKRLQRVTLAAAGSAQSVHAVAAFLLLVVTAYLCRCGGSLPVLPAVSRPTPAHSGGRLGNDQGAPVRTQPGPGLCVWCMLLHHASVLWWRSVRFASFATPTRQRLLVAVWL